MKKAPWLAAAIVAVAVLLCIHGFIAAWIISAVHELEISPNTPFATAEDIAWAQNHLPALYLLAAQGVLLGVLALFAACAVWKGWSGARRTVLVTSAVLMLTAAAATVLAPHQWDTQALFVLFCGLLSWELRKPS